MRNRDIKSAMKNRDTTTNLKIGISINIGEIKPSRLSNRQRSTFLPDQLMKIGIIRFCGSI